MLINCLHHPLLHDTSRMRTVNVDISPGCLILESHTWARSRPLGVLMITKVCQKTKRFFIRKVLRLLPSWYFPDADGECRYMLLLEPLYQLILCPHICIILGAKVLNLVLTSKCFRKKIMWIQSTVPKNSPMTLKSSDYFCNLFQSYYCISSYCSLNLITSRHYSFCTWNE